MIGSGTPTPNTRVRRELAHINMRIPGLIGLHLNRLGYFHPNELNVVAMDSHLRVLDKYREPP
jgi:hypothetical protein